jgi:hypothetical protein
MAFARGPKIVTNGLVLSLDAANPRSCIQGNNLIPGTGSPYLSTSGWSEAGWTGSLTVNTSENALELSSTNGWHNMYYDTSIINTDVVVSFEGKWKQNESGSWAFFTNGKHLGNSGTEGVKFITYFDTSTYKKYTHSYTASSNGYVCIGSRNRDYLGLTDILLLKNIKLEIGDVSTEWTPSIYDENWLDLIGTSDGSLVNYPIYDNNNSTRLVFDGTRSYIDLGNNNTFGGADNFTINLWFKTTSPSSHFVGIISKHSSAGSAGSLGTGFMLSPHSTASGHFRTYIRDSSNIGGLVDGPEGYDIRDGNFYQLTFVLNKQGNSFNAINGIPGNYANFSSMGSILNDTNLYIARNYGLCPCEISLVQIYNRALTIEEITQNYRALKGRFI